MLTPYGIEIKRRLKALGMTETELCVLLSDWLGKKIYPPFLSSVLHGKRPGKEIRPEIEILLSRKENQS